MSLVPPVLDAPRHVRVKAVFPQGEDEAVVFFDGVDDVGTAEMLAGCHCLMRRDEIDASVLEEDEGVPSLVGWKVYDVSVGYLGVVEAVEDRPLQPLLEVAREGGTSVLIPLAEEFVVDVDEDGLSLKLDCPRGLLDL